MLEMITNNVWSIPVQFKIFGLIQLNGRATVIRLKNNDLWVHSPVKLTDELKNELDQLGEVRYLVAPSLFHHLFVGAWREHYPQASVYTPAGLEKKRKDLHIDYVLSDGKQTHPHVWSEEIECIPIQGIPQVREHIFYHHASQTCMITDLCFFFREAEGFSRIYLKLNRVHQKLATPLLFKTAIRNKKAFSESLDVMKQWDVKYISLCHHAILSGDELEHWNHFIQNT
jgi:hypothetical protein